MKLEHCKGTKMSGPDFWKKNLWESHMGEKPHFGVSLNFFVYIFASSHSNVLKFHICDKFNKSSPGCLVGTRPLFWDFVVFWHFWCFSHYVSSDAVIWTTWNLDRMYSIYSYLLYLNYASFFLFNNNFRPKIIFWLLR